MRSWNRQPVVSDAAVVDCGGRDALLPEGACLLPFGNGRSYGDVCLNEGGTLLRTRRLDHFISFDASSGRLVCESGVLLKDILDVVVPRGWFLPVVPGTRLVTVGGAIANDVHGKNHHISGSFGHHVRRLELLRSDGVRYRCSADENADWFYATIGGLGLTGLIISVELQLMPIANAFMVTEAKRFCNLGAFWELNAEAEMRWPYTVAWIDCMAAGDGLGRGVFFAGRHAPAQDNLPVWRENSCRVPCDLPISLINKYTSRGFNGIYYRRPLPKGEALSHYVPYFFPLDGIGGWNRIYGTAGFYQYQCVLPPSACREGIARLLKMVAESGMGSFLAVLKMFGDRPSLGMLSFPRRGATLALDLPNCGEKTLRLMREFDAVVREAGGAIYPAKDARMPGELFRAAYPQWEKFSAFIDPHFSSSFWRRVTG